MLYSRFLQCIIPELAWMTWSSEVRLAHQRPFLTQPSFSGIWARQTSHGAYPWPLLPITWHGNLSRSTRGSEILGKDSYTTSSTHCSGKISLAYNKYLGFSFGPVFPPKTVLRRTADNGPDGLVFHSFLTGRLFLVLKIVLTLLC